MPLRTAAKLCPQAIFVDGHPDRYREYSGKFMKSWNIFSASGNGLHRRSLPRYDGTERLYGPPLKAAHMLHQTHEGRDAV